MTELILEPGQNIADFINKSAWMIKEDDLDWVTGQLVDHYSSKLNSLAYNAYGQSNATAQSVSYLSFREQSKDEIKKAIHTYLFVKKHWAAGRDISSYLLTTLNRLSDRIKWDASGAKKTNTPVCPCCKSFGHREYLVADGKFLRCNNCLEEIDRTEEEIKIAKKAGKPTSALEASISTRRLFATHSRKGYRCPDCDKFIPASLASKSSNIGGAISCPYNDCFFFGDVLSLELMAHPLGMTLRNDVSLSAPVGKDEGSNTIEDMMKGSGIDAVSEISIRQEYKIEHKALLDVIKIQSDRLKSKSTSSTYLQKTLMYEAYAKMLEKYPEEMVSYLVHLKQRSEFPIQSRIFQEYVALIEQAMPFSINKSGDSVDILSLTDPNLCLFVGVSKFNAEVDRKRTIPNNTIETYTGGRKMKFRGPCFIGKVIDVRDVSQNASIVNSIKQHSFVQIEMNEDVQPGTQVEVTHFRILPHYEIGSLVYLQRIRRKIVDSVYFKLNGKKREITRGQNNE